MNRSVKIVVYITITISFILCIYLIGENVNSRRNQEIEANLGEAFGTITDYGYSGKSLAKDARYEFQYSGEIYRGAFGMNGHQDYFEKECLKQGLVDCIGVKFKIEFSTLNPNYSRIVVGKYIWNKNIGS